MVVCEKNTKKRTKVVDKFFYSYQRQQQKWVNKKQKGSDTILGVCVAWGQLHHHTLGASAIPASIVRFFRSFDRSFFDFWSGSGPRLDFRE